MWARLFPDHHENLSECLSHEMFRGQSTFDTLMIMSSRRATSTSSSMPYSSWSWMASSGARNTMTSIPYDPVQRGASCHQCRAVWGFYLYHHSTCASSSPHKICLTLAGHEAQARDEGTTCALDLPNPTVQTPQDT
ncbi:hypothetical protein DPMN_132216 [Dreissena polymorpha]|uniref:Uncharacterized protein n=1 Tax=Dreissena polymorpha TaxID=45954 RepID=A0A9D4JBV7_DREPO|nr:hypothetical protein DPMN_132216 [Dreissena polymorpha]